MNSEEKTKVEAGSELSARLGRARDLLNRAIDPWTEIEKGNQPRCRERSNSKDGTPCGAPATRIAAGGLHGILVCEKCANLYYAHSSIQEANKEHWAMVHNLIERALDELA